MQWSGTETTVSPRYACIHIMGIPEWEEKENGAESIFKAIMAGKLPISGERKGQPEPRGPKNPKYVEPE